MPSLLLASNAAPALALAQHVVLWGSVALACFFAVVGLVAVKSLFGKPAVVASAPAIEIPVEVEEEPEDETDVYSSQRNAARTIIKRIDIFDDLNTSLKKNPAAGAVVQQLELLREDLIDMLRTQHRVEPIEIEPNTPLDVRMRKLVRIVVTERSTNSQPRILETVRSGYCIVDPLSKRRIPVRKPEVRVEESGAAGMS
jgi:hypothetical protein